MHNTFRAILAMTTFLVTGALSSCNHTDELEPESPAPQIVFLFSPGGLGDMSYNDRILEGVQRFKMENGDIDIYIRSFSVFTTSFRCVSWAFKVYMKRIRRQDSRMRFMCVKYIV